MFVSKGEYRLNAESTSISISETSGIAVTGVILRRELTRFFRQPARIGAAVGTPVILWLFFASGFSGAMGNAGSASSNAGAASSYSLYLLPGMMTLVAMFTAIFASISIIEDRNEGWLQSVLVSPAPRWSIAAGKMLGGSTIAFVQAIALLLALPLLGDFPGVFPVVQAIASLAVVCIAMTGVGVAFAWMSESTQGFHAVMNLVLMPLWMLSGAFFSPDTAAPWLRIPMYLNPLTWATAAIRLPLLSSSPESTISGADAGADIVALSVFNDPDKWWLTFAISVVFALAAFGIATAIVARPTKSA